MGLELGYIYGQSPLSEEEKEGLLIKTIASRSELDEFEQQNIETAIEWTLMHRFINERILSFDFVKEVHKRMFDRVWAWAGTFRKTNKNIGVDKFQISADLKILFDDCKYWIENETYSHDEIAIWFKFRLVKIHPFPNGNGRHSRLCADILISNVFEKEVYSWGGLSLTEPGRSRMKYIESLHDAERGDIKPLIEFAKS